jgi:cytochrome P450
MDAAVELASGPGTAAYWSRSAAAGRGLPAGPVHSTPWAMMSAFNADPLGYFHTAFRTFGDVVSLRAWPFTSFFLAHPDHIKHVLQEHNQAYVKGVVIAKLKVLIGEGLFTSEGDFWRRQRRLAQPAFHRQRLAGFVGTMTETAATVLDRWAPRVRDGAPLDVSAQMSALTLGVVGRTLFSRSLDDETDQVSHALREVLALLDDRMGSFVPAPLWWPSTATRRLRRAIGMLDRVVYDIIEGRRRQPEGPGDLLAMLMAARDEETGQTMTDRQLRDEVMTFLLAGHETTAMALSWTWYLLARHPEVEARLCIEVDALGGRTPTIDDLPRLSYARQVVEEAMRLYPPVWGFVRQAVRPDEIAGYRIHKGAVINIMPWVTHRHPAFWHDPEAFDPDHFAPERVRERPRFAYLPFSGGPRQCIGNEFAVMEAQLVVAMTLQRYRLRLTTARPTVVPEVQLTLRPKDGLPMHVLSTRAPR